ncbi:MAG: hypothetical protein OEU99_17030 [Nitrospira sp.]|nr:hypothetical protein [Nitrospira sp.]
MISPRYSTCRCATRPSGKRRFSTTLKVRWTLPSFLRVFDRKNMEKYRRVHAIPQQPRSALQATSTIDSLLHQSVSSALSAKIVELEGELVKLGYGTTEHYVWEAQQMLEGAEGKITQV